MLLSIFLMMWLWSTCVAFVERAFVEVASVNHVSVNMDVVESDL